MQNASNNNSNNNNMGNNNNNKKENKHLRLFAMKTWTSSISLGAYVCVSVCVGRLGLMSVEQVRH